MNILAIFNRQPTQPVLELTAADRLAATLRPDPEARAKRLAQWSRERQERYFAACFGTPQSLLRRGRERYAATYSPQGQAPNSAPAGFDV